VKNSIIYKGVSLLDGSPIVAAIKTGLDAGICGDCRHRGDGTGKGRTCYVNVGQGALAVYKAFTRGRYPVADDLPALGRGRIIRLGTYGDPAAVPVEIWQGLTREALAFTGYTHRWKQSDTLRGLCMASVDSEQEAKEATAKGWRYFRVALPAHVAKIGNERTCPASKEAGQLTTCADCRACNGTATNRKASIVIQAHGSAPVMANIRKLSNEVRL